ncbi:hypothetical protein HAX54_031392 [Datura stramonium]|uniref:Uncharacterized protein n=1 Tax=Datura stramonium TaxID=4076 RepID=A0ABS8SBU3_DATST|nr:hypothetical protein [Datura stramonium]
MFSPTITAIFVVFDHVEHEDAYKTCIECFLAIAKISSFHHLEDILDDLLISLFGRAPIWAAGRHQKCSSSHEDEDTAVFCLELLITITLNNKDRISLLLQEVYEHIAIIVHSIVMPCALIEKAIFGLLCIFLGLLPYKENLLDELLRSLQHILKLDARVADPYCE